LVVTCVTDEWGEVPAVVAPGVSAHAFPLGWVAKRLAGGGRFDDVGLWFERLVEVCAENAAAARRR